MPTHGSPLTAADPGKRNLRDLARVMASEAGEAPGDIAEKTIEVYRQPGNGHVR